MATDNSEDESASHETARFATTHWSVVLAAEDGAAPGATQALEELCQAYWYPLYAYVRRRGYGVEEAQDLTQEFFARLIRKPRLGEADPSKGRFRNFLLTALNNFLRNEWRRSRAAKRGGGQVLISLDDTAEARYAQEGASDLTPERIYEQRWAVSVFDSALRRLRAQYAAANKTRHFDQLRKYLSMEAAPGEYARLGRELELSPGAVAAAVRPPSLRSKPPRQRGKSQRAVVSSQWSVMLNPQPGQSLSPWAEGHGCCPEPIPAQAQGLPHSIHSA